MNDFKISKLKMSRFSAATASIFYGEHKSKPFFPNLQQFITSDVVVGMELVAENAVDKWRGFIGPTNTLIAKKDAPDSLRAYFGTDGTKNAVHGSDSSASYKKEAGFFFPEDAKQRQMNTTAQLNSCTLCIIKPHIVAAGQAGMIIDMILSEGFEISALEMFYLNKPTAEEFYDVYKGVLPEYVPLIDHMTSGPVIVLEVRQENAIPAFRNLVGPHDPEIAKHLRPNTIR
jgi:nucleoside-diphosphate kinase